MSPPPAPYLKLDGSPAAALTSQQQDRAEGLAYAKAWKARGGAWTRWREYLADHRLGSGAAER